MTFSTSNDDQLMISLPYCSDWDEQAELISASSHEEANKVFEQWQSDHEDDGNEIQDDDIMQVDEQIGSNLLGDDFFLQHQCDAVVSADPSSPIEELIFMNADEDNTGFTTVSEEGQASEKKPALESTQSSSSPMDCLPFQERYQATLVKLAESMKRSGETRRSLTIKPPSLEAYPRSATVRGILQSIESSTQQLQSVYQLSNMHARQ